MNKKIKHTLKSGFTLSLAGGMAIGGTAAGIGTGIVNTYAAETLSNLKQVSVKDGWYTFASVQDESFVLDINVGGPEKNKNLRLYKNNGSEQQKFYIESVGNGEYKINTGASNGNLTLNAVKGDNSLGDNVNQYTYSSSSSDEKWKIYQDTSGNYVFLSSTGDKVLDICGTVMSNNTNIWLWNYYGAKTQKWKLNPVSSVNHVISPLNNLKPATVQDGWYMISSSANNNLVLEVKDGADKNGANIYGNTKSESKNQQFYFESVGGNEYAIKTAVSDKRKAVDVSGGSPERGVNVRQWEYYNGNAVHWKLYTDDDGNYVLVSSTGDKVLDLTGAKTTAGTNVWTWDYYGAGTQEWKLVPVANPMDSLKPTTVENGWYQILSSANNNLALEVENGSDKNGTNIFGNTKNGSANQKFYFESVGGNEYAIKTYVSNKSKAVDVSGGSPEKGVNVRQWEYYDGNAVHWKLYTNEKGDYVLVSSTGDKVLDLTGAKTTAGTNVWTWNYYGANTQEWKLNKVNDIVPAKINNGWYQITSSANSNLALEVKDGADKNGANIFGNTKSGSNSQKFYIESVGDNEYAVKTAVSNKTKAMDVSGASPDRGINVGQWEYYGGDAVHWKLYKDTDGNYIFVSSTGDKVLDLTGAKTTAGTNVWTWDYYGANTQEWNLVPTTANISYVQEIPNGTYTIGLASNNNYVFDVAYGSSKNATKIQLMNRNGGVAQLFRIQYAGNGEYIINTGATFYNSSIDVLGGNTANAVIDQWTNNNLNTQRWRITKVGDGYVFRSVLDDSLVLDASGIGNGAPLTLAGYNEKDNTQKFTLSKGSAWYISGDRKYYFNENGNKPEVGIDVSYHNGTIDWAKVKADNISYAIIRSGYRSEYTSPTTGKRNIGKDVKFEENISNAEKVGMPYGVYFYSTATTIAEADEEADAIINAIKGKNPSRGVYIDIESTVVYQEKLGNIYNSYARRRITDVTKRVCDRLKAEGYSVGVYASESYFKDVLYSDELEGYMWVARYYTNTPTDTNTLNLNSSIPYKYWQYSSVGRVNGISTDVDMNTTVR
ncbi:MAG: RICIN domain-containing protein [Lachnospiraceae bacterium]|nr:RICIN domain-containing protein [Lachnospiraceae bacterium]